MFNDKARLLVPAQINKRITEGAILRGVWFKALSLTAGCLSPLRDCILSGACEKVASDLELGGFLHQLQLASHNLAAKW